MNLSDIYFTSTPKKPESLDEFMNYLNSNGPSQSKLIHMDLEVSGGSPISSIGGCLSDSLPEKEPQVFQEVLNNRCKESEGQLHVKSTENLLEDNLRLNRARQRLFTIITSSGENPPSNAKYCTADKYALKDLDIKSVGVCNETSQMNVENECTFATQKLKAIKDHFIKMYSYWCNESRSKYDSGISNEGFIAVPHSLAKLSGINDFIGRIVELENVLELCKIKLETSTAENARLNLQKNEIEEKLHVLKDDYKQKMLELSEKEKDLSSREAKCSAVLSRLLEDVREQQEKHSDDIAAIITNLKAEHKIIEDSLKAVCGTTDEALTADELSELTDESLSLNNEHLSSKIFEMTSELESLKAENKRLRETQNIMPEKCLHCSSTCSSTGGSHHGYFKNVEQAEHFYLLQIEEYKKAVSILKKEVTELKSRK